jgi:phosphoribosylamine---glycine ligase
MATVDVLLIGGGGREHALAWKLRQSPHCGRLLAAPGSAGIAELAECRPLCGKDVDEVTTLAVEEKIGLAVIGPEVALAEGLADRLRAAGMPVFGPSAAAARIETSKAYARELMTRMDVPQPEHRAFFSAAAAEAYLDELAHQGVAGVVVKASGLAAGKGAIVCDTLDEARAAVHEIMVDRVFGESGDEVLIEERLFGEEASLLVLTDGTNIAPLLPAQDYKRALDGDKGLNTGGMGTYAPAPLVTPALYEECLERIVRPTLAGLRADGCPFLGCLYLGLMQTARGPKVIEFNCRFGDPETQVVLPLLDSDLLELFLAAANGELGQPDLRWKEEKAVCVVLASGGYPGPFEKGKAIHGLDAAAAVPGALVFHAGTTRIDAEWRTNGGRVLNVVGTGATFAAAIDTAYRAADLIHFDGVYRRSDIAARVRETS